MSRSTIDFGIDLGTTNSAIAVLKGTETEIIKNDLNSDITPSAVFMKKNGETIVGLRAKSQLEDLKTENDVHVEFKRNMGKDFRYVFQTSGKSQSPEELSAVVLKELWENAEQYFHGEARAAVITVPAAFKVQQCAATRAAGVLAGMLQCPLVQEPVAAALAYGFQSDVKKEYWLVYDFGGGTFDAALMHSEDGCINVVNHGGDMYLGGADIDWAITEELIVPDLTKNFNLPDFRRGNARWKANFSRLKRAVEEAKIQLSRREYANLEGCTIVDADGEEQEVEFRIARDVLIRHAAPLIERSVEICKRVLEEKKLSPRAIEKGIFVGGPTIAPYFREMVRDQLGIEFDQRIDPLTVVARGAAVFAGTQRLESHISPKVKVGQFAVTLNYKPIGIEEDPLIRGEVKSSGSPSMAGFTIEFENQKTRWKSGKVAIKPDGKFKANLLAIKGGANTFSIGLYDSIGAKQSIVPETLQYTIGQVIAEQPVINSLSLALADNSTKEFFKKGSPLPSKKMHLVKTAKALKKGESGQDLRLPIVEGENLLADRNTLIGYLEIKTESVRRDLPAGTEIEVELTINASRELTLKAYVPALDEEFVARISLEGRHRDVTRLAGDLEEQTERLGNLRDIAATSEETTATQLLDQAAAICDGRHLRQAIDAGGNDPMEADKAEIRLLELKVLVDQAEDLLKWPTFVAEATKALEELDELIDGLDQPTAHEKRANAKSLREEVQEAIRQRRTEQLKKKLEQVADLHRDILFDQPGFWLGFFNHLVASRTKMHDTVLADKLINQGRRFIDDGEVQGLRRVVGQLLELLPRDVAESLKKGYQSGVI